MKKSILIFVLFFIAGQLFAQTDSISVLNKYCIPHIKGIPIGKGFSIDYENQPNYSIETIDKTGLFGDSKTEIKTNTRLKIKAKIPILNKPYLTILGGLKYSFEEYHFQNNSGKNPLYTGLEDKGLKTIGTDLLIIKPTKSKNYWLLRIKADFNGDYDGNFVQSEYLKFSISPAWGRKVSDNFTYALGLSYNYRFGSPLILPIISFNKNLNTKWDIESILPVFVKVRYKYNDGLHWINTIDLDGASYKINSLDSSLPGYSNIHLHRSDIRFTTRIEKKLTGWFWLAADLGLNQNLVYNVTNSNRARNEVLFENNLKTGFLFNFSIFISPHLKY